MIWRKVHWITLRLSAIFKRQKTECFRLTTLITARKQRTGCFSSRFRGVRTADRFIQSGGKSPSTTTRTQTSKLEWHRSTAPTRINRRSVTTSVSKDCRRFCFFATTSTTSTLTTGPELLIPFSNSKGRGTKTHRMHRCLISSSTR